MRVADKPIAFIDIETSGLWPWRHEILELACIRRDGKEVKRWSRKIIPRAIHKADKKALEIIGYSAEKWADAIPLSEAFEEMRVLMRGAVLCGHNVRFDLDFIDRNMKKETGTGRGFHHTIDTMTLAYEHLQDPCGSSLSLARICDVLKISNEGAHGALVDCERTMQVFDKLHRASAWKRFVWRVSA